MDRALKERIVGAVVLVAIVVLVVPVFLDGPAPEGRAMISEPVLLPGQSREPGERRTVVLERDRDQPLPDTPEAALHPVAAAAEREAGAGAASDEDGASRTGGPVSDTAAAPAEETAEPAATTDTATARESKPQSTPEPKRESAPPPDTKTALATKEPAPERASPEPAEGESATGMWAVQLGSFSSKANADRLAAKLRAEGYAAFLSQLETASGELHRVRIGPQKDRAGAEAVARRLSAEGLKGQVVPHP